MLRDNDLTADMMKDAKKKGGAWNKKTQEIFAKTVTNPAVQNTAGADWAVNKRSHNHIALDFS